MQKLQEVHVKAASLLDQCRALAGKDTVSAEHLAGRVISAYAGASKRFPMLKQKLLLPAAHGFEEVQDRLIDIRLQAGTTGFRKMELFVEEGGMLMVPDSFSPKIYGLRHKCKRSTRPGSNTATCVVLDSSMFQLVITVPSNVVQWILNGVLQTFRSTGQSSSSRYVFTAENACQTWIAWNMECNAGRPLRLHNSTQPSLQLADGLNISGKLAHHSPLSV